MKFQKLWSWKATVLTCLVLVVAHAQSDVSRKVRAVSGRTCESLRHEMSLLFEQIYEKMPSLLNVMMGAVHDPATGTRIEFGVDLMKRMIVNTFTSFLPPCSHLSRAPGHGEPTTPDGHAPKLHHDMGFPSRFYTKSNSLKRHRDGKLRRRRSSSSSIDAKIGSDYITIGDAALPLELFQQQDKGGEDEEKNTISLDFVV